MPGDLRQLGGFAGSGGDPTTINEATAYAIGDLGKIVAVNNTTLIGSGFASGQGPVKYFQKVKLDSASGVTTGQVLVWKDHISYTVTTASSNTAANVNKFAGADQTGTISAGVITSNATAGNFIWMQIGGLAVVLIEAGQTPAVGDTVIVGATTAGRFGITASGTAPISLGVGVILATKTTTFAGSGTLPTDYCAVYLWGNRFIV